MGFKPEDLILPGASILSDGINAVVDGINTRASRRWQEKMMQWQRNSALTDYGMQNEYNSPSAQMERLKKAGLNPNLVYGTGTATMPASNIKSSSPPSTNTSRVNIDGGGAVGTYLNAKQMQLQNDNLKAQNDVLLEQKKNLAADTVQKLFGGNLKEFDFNLKTQLRNNTISKAWQITKNLDTQGNLTQAQIANTKERTKTETETRTPKIQAILQSVSESTQRILNMKIQAAKTVAEISYIQTQIQNAVKDGTLKQLDINLKRLGGTWSDPAWQRRAMQLLSNIGL